MKVPAELAAQLVCGERRVHGEFADGARKAGRSARRELFDRDVHAGRLQLAPQIIDFVPAAKERIDIAAALYDNLCNGGDRCGFDHERTRLLRVEQTLFYDCRFIDLAVQGFTLPHGVRNVDVLRPEAVEGGEFNVFVAHDRHPAVELEGRQQGFAFEDRLFRYVDAQQQIVFGNLSLGFLLDTFIRRV